MDLNTLYRRHRLSRFMSQYAACERSRDAHGGLMAGHAMRIAEAKLAESTARPVAYIHPRSMKP